MAALYQQIQQDLLGKIKSGHYRVGEVLPTEVELAGRYGVSRPTMRQALKALADAGYLDKRKRRGTVVTRPKVDQDFTSSVNSFVDDMRRHGHVARSVVITFRRQEASAEVARRLQVVEGAEVYKLVRLRYVDEGPNVLVESYVPAQYYPDLERYDFTTMRLYRAMAEQGRPVVRAHRRLDVICADVAVAALLDVDEGAPLFLFHTLGYTADDVPVEYSVATYRGDNNSFEFDVRAD